MNRCSLPAEALASFAFQLAPCELELDGVVPLHRPLFELLEPVGEMEARAALFRSYMNAHFLLDDPAAQGWSERARLDRSRLDYLKLLRGWLFDPESREAAVLKAWVESRFGLLTRFHNGPVGEAGSPARAAFDHEAALGLYATASVEAQIDLVYAWSQHELRRRFGGASHLLLYRGYSGAGLDVLRPLDDTYDLVELNNLSSFSANRERADEFGDRVLACEVPLPKILAFSGLMPGLLQGEAEFLVIGGVCAVRQLY